MELSTLARPFLGRDRVSAERDARCLVGFSNIEPKGSEYPVAQEPMPGADKPLDKRGAGGGLALP